uniref:coproporphyrinogen III oxidase n=1 Tax=Pelomicrobium sp. TaxID=2815319 RepID=UPI002FDD4A9D
MELDAVKGFLTSLQDEIVSALEAVDGECFRRDRWQRPEGGGGDTRVMEEG